jgi:hypothetical protein
MVDYCSTGGSYNVHGGEFLFDISRIERVHEDYFYEVLNVVVDQCILHVLKEKGKERNKEKFRKEKKKGKKGIRKGQKK